MSKNENKNGNCQLSIVFIPKSKDPQEKKIKTKQNTNNNKISKSFLVEVTMNELNYCFHDHKAKRESYTAL